MLRLGPSRLLIVVAVGFALLALVSPVWTITVGLGGSREVSSYHWTTRTQDQFEGSVWQGTETVPYYSSRVTERSLVYAIGTSYLLGVVLILILLIVLALFSMGQTKAMPVSSLLITSVLVVGVALVALLFPVVALPAAATTDFAAFTFNGFWGSAQTSLPPQDWSWAPGLGWWSLALAVILGVVGGTFPYIRSIRAMGPVPRPSQPPT